MEGSFFMKGFGCQKIFYEISCFFQINWIRVTTILSTRIIKDAILPLDSEDRANVLIIDDCQTELQTAGADSYYGEHCL